LYFECTTNIVEYEALIIGLNLLREDKEKRVCYFIDSESVVKQVFGTYQTKHLRRRAYQNEVWDMFDNLFLEHKIYAISREENSITYSLATTTSAFKIPIYLNRKYEINVNHRPSIPNNIKHW